MCEGLAYHSQRRQAIRLPLSLPLRILSYELELVSAE